MKTQNTHFKTCKINP